MLSSSIERALSQRELHPVFENVLSRLQHELHERTLIEWRTVAVTSSLTADVAPYLGGERYDCMPPSAWGEFFAFIQGAYPISCYHHACEGVVTLMFLGYLNEP